MCEHNPHSCVKCMHFMEKIHTKLPGLRQFTMRHESNIETTRFPFKHWELT
jgi:hypothetical protein